MSHYQTNTKVEWDWGEGTATGYIREKFVERVERNLKGSDVVRNASESDPAYMIEQPDGDKVLKSHYELRKA